MNGTNNRSTFKGWLSDFFNLFSPRFCAICSESLTPSEQLLCSHCLITLPYTRIHDFYSNDVVNQFLARIPIERGYSYIWYRSGTDSHTLLEKLKYQHRPDIGTKLGRNIGQELKAKGFFSDIDAIVPVPLHWKRWITRGYNQSTQLANGISAVTGLPVEEHLVRRIRNNTTQTGMNSSQRQDNVENIFLSRETCYHHLLLVDDVLTTGATLTSCAQSILRQNPKVRFSVLTLAKA